MNTRSFIALILAAISALVLSQHTLAASITCTASNTTINFGAYPVLSGTVLDGTGNFQVTCVNSNASGATVTYTAKLPPTSTLRQLAPPSGSDRLSYTLYVDSARTQIWGDGTGGTSTITGSIFVGRNSSVTDTVKNFYGRISPGGQDVSAVSPGPSPTTYSQSLTITVTCTGSGAC